MQTVHYTTSYTVTGLIHGASHLYMLLRTEKERKDEKEKNASPEIVALNKLYPMNTFAVFGLNVTLAGLVAACIEGALNHLVITELFGSDDPNSQSDKQKVFRDFVRDKVELDGGWSKAQQFFLMAFDKSIQDVVGSPLNQALDHLNTVRNSTAHGSTIVFPDSPLPQSASDVYPYSWQKKLSRCSTYLDGVLETRGLTEHLKNPDLGYHWWRVISDVSRLFISAFTNHPGTRFFQQITTLEPGYHWTPPQKN